MAGWTIRQGAPALVAYSLGGGYPTPSDPGPAARGSRFFSGGNSPVTELVQDVAVPAGVDSGSVRYTLGGWLGGYLGQEDGVQLSVEFRDAKGAPLALSVLGPVTSGERAARTALLQRSVTSTVPPGARSARVRLVFTRAGGTSNDGYADAVSLVLTGLTGLAGGGAA
ncbi:phosphoesterase [Streptomyces sp. NPDC051211]|uniref:phosphoesterase n=1 Tax=Streptomyces sp. NPDC051211 TaxID=3154643 RepID=UPI00344DC9EA